MGLISGLRPLLHVNNPSWTTPSLTSLCVLLHVNNPCEQPLVNLDGKTGLVSGFQDWKYPGTLTQTWQQAQMTQIYSNPLNFFVSPCPKYPCHTVYFFIFLSFTRNFFEGKILFIRIFWRTPSPKPVTTGLWKLDVSGMKRTVEIVKCRFVESGKKTLLVPVVSTWTGDFLQSRHPSRF